MMLASRSEREQLRTLLRAKLRILFQISLLKMQKAGDLHFLCSIDVTFLVFCYLWIGSRKKNITLMIMTYIIQNRIVRIFYNDRDYSEELKQLLFPSQRNEHQKAITVIRL